MLRCLATTGLTVLFCIMLPSPASPQTPRFSRAVVDTDGPNWAADRGMHVKAVGDLNQDGYSDLIVAGSLIGEPLVWYASPGWSRHLISTLGGWSADAEIGDIDGDGDPDLVISSWYRADAGLEWFENKGATARWSRHVIGPPKAHDFSLVDLDLDRDLDIVSREQEPTGDRLQFWRQVAPTLWENRTLNGIPPGEGLDVADIDNDQDVDVIIAGVWLENTLDMMAGPWTIRPFTSTWDYPHVVIASGDLNQDGRPDIVLAPSEPAGQAYRISWFECPPDPLNSSGWTEHVVQADTETVVHSLQLRDFDRDGDIDILVAEMHQSDDPDEIAIYLNDGPGGTAISFTRQLIDGGGAHNIRAGDFDGDGYDDFFGPNWTGTRTVEAWMNLFRLERLDFNGDQAVDAADLAILVNCGTGPSVPYDVRQPPPGCNLPLDDQGRIPPDLDRDGDVDSLDFAALQRDLQLAP